MSRLHRSMLFALAATLLPALPARAQETAPDSFLVVKHYLDFESVSDPHISPDGGQIIYTRRWVNAMEDRMESALWIMSADGSRNRFFAKGSSAAWSPDGKRVAYLADGEPAGTQIFVRWVDAEGPGTQVTRVEESPGNVRWSPDGTQLGFSMFVPQPKSWKIDMPSAPEGAKWTKPPRDVDRLHFRQDRRGFTQPGFVHLFVVPADGGTPRQITHGDWNVGARFDGLSGGVAWDWMPDGKTIVVEGYAEDTGDLNYRDANLYAVTVATGALHRLTPERGTWAGPVISPDGKRIAYSGYPYSTASYEAGDVYVMNADGSGIRKITGGFDREAGELHWSQDGSGVYFSAADRGASNIFFASVNGGAVRPITTGQHALSLTDLSTGGVAVGIRSTPTAPTDVVRLDLRRPTAVTQLTHVNDDLLDHIRLGDVHELWVTSSGGARVEGWFVTPPNYDAAKKYPLILEIHGGPHSLYLASFNYMMQNFAANGYVVLYTNPRGSTGYGTSFANAIQHAYPSVDYDDLMAAVDTLVGRGMVDTTRMFVSGCSGGGVLSSWVIGHTTRFAAAAVRCPVIDWISFAGHTDIPFFTYNFFDAPFWEKPEQWLKQSSLMYVGNVTTPTLLMTGQLDMRTPMPQTEEYFAALKVRGVPAELLMFEGEYHGTGSRPSNFMRTQLYMMSWFQRWGGKRATATSAGAQ
ncbi:MAG TPA: S9 family peptidase [Gemmatimonadaceae bacterium]|nr:S9 family peptidase [Gemmatimonadaceae bacterium]